MNVAENLYDYLKHNDQAELIGLGTFYVKNSSARINDLNGTIEPPKKELFFTREQKGNRDFVSFMAKHEFISEDTAYTWIKQYSDSLNEKILAGRSITLGKLGRIEKGLLEDYNFIASDGLNLLDDAFALGTLKNVQTFDNTDEVELIRTKPQQHEEVKDELPQEFEQKKSEIEQSIEQARQLKEDEKAVETDEQTKERIIQHSEAVIESDVVAPVMDAESEVTKLDVDAVGDEDKTQQTIDRAAEFKEKVIVEDIKPAEDKVQKGETQPAIEQEDELKKQAEEIVRRHDKKKIKIKTPKRRNTNKRKRVWLTLFWIIIAILLLCIAFVACHWFGLLKDIKVLKPVTDRLAYYIPVREKKADDKTVPADKVPVQTMTEESYTGEIEYNEPQAEISSVQTAYQPQQSMNNVAKKPAQKQNAKKQTEEQTVQPTQPKVEPSATEDNTPVVTQTHSKLGFDVIGGSFADKSKAEAQARKAKRLGYDGYVVSKIKGGTPIYYVSYGSRRTLAEANDLMQNMISRLGGNYYVMSR